jgi:LmbE family N-acetylglucosaminyl deacetylase
MDDWNAGMMGRVLVLVAHADDESVAYGALLQRARRPVVVIATDGAPQDSYFWGSYGSREKYAAVRCDEARRAAALAGVGELVLLAERDVRLVDQRLFLNLPAAYALLEKIVERVRPESIATLAYEGGHPDHDCCSLLGAMLGERFAVPVWEAPLYHRAGGGAADIAEIGVAGIEAGGELRLQQFIDENGGERLLEITPEELERKREMCAQYVSQGTFLGSFDAAREVMRPQVKYDYRRAPHTGLTNYEQWQWWMSARDVSAKLGEFAESMR